MPQKFAGKETSRTIQIRSDQTLGDRHHVIFEVDQPFGYWFDYGDDWWHQIDVQVIALAH
ncbi:MAG: hypothetical protein JXB62_19060 [Pirellulales bacterium]|nr:hypothetical protein [Pirellulales bacterium]